MTALLQIGDIAVDVIRKEIKNIHLSVYPPTGRVRISAPTRLSLNTIRIFAVSKIGWIRRQQQKLQEQERETPREYLDRESHYLWGRRYLLKVVEGDHPAKVELTPHSIILQVRPQTSQEKRQAIMDVWCRELVKEAAPLLIAKWGPLMNVRVERLFVQRMKTRWGSCNPRRQTIRLNAELAKKPRECLEYIVVHEMAHLLEASHGPRFVALMDRFMPKWRGCRDILNRLPVRHERWGL